MSESLSEQLAARLAARAETAPETPTPDAPETNAPDPEPETPEIAPAEGTPEPSEATDEPEDIQTLMDFGKAAGWEPDDVYALKFTIDNGTFEGEELALGEIKDRLQAYAREHESVAEQTKRLNEYAQQLQTQAQEYFSQRQTEGAEAQAARESMTMVEARYNSVDWDKLAAADPGRAALLQQQLAVDYAGAKQGYQAAMAKEQQAMAAMAEQSRTQQAQALLNLVPEWKDQTRVQAEYPALQAYLQQQGFRPQELETIYDARAINIARKAMLYDQGVVKMKETQDKIKAAPKPVVKPGTGRLYGAAAQAREASLINKARETGREADKMTAARAVLERALGGKR